MAPPFQGVSMLWTDSAKGGVLDLQTANSRAFSTAGNHPHSPMESVERDRTHSVHTPPHPSQILFGDAQLSYKILMYRTNVGSTRHDQGSGAEIV